MSELKSRAYLSCWKQGTQLTIEARVPQQVSGEDVYLAGTRTNAEEVMDSINEQLRAVTVLVSVDAGNSAIEAVLKQVGSQIFSQLIPANVRDAIIASTAAGLVIQQEDLFVPFELTFDGQDFWGLQYAIATILVRREMGDIRHISDAFADTRHLFRLPNLNPNAPLSSGDPGRPRSYFGRWQHEDVWFGEAELLQSANLQRAACAGPILLSRIYHGIEASLAQIDGAMTMAGYRRVTDPSQPLNEGEYRFVPENAALVEVYLKRNTRQIDQLTNSTVSPRWLELSFIQVQWSQ